MHSYTVAFVFTDLTRFKKGTLTFNSYDICHFFYPRLGLQDKETIQGQEILCYAKCRRTFFF